MADHRLSEAERLALDGREPDALVASSAYGTHLANAAAALATVERLESASKPVVEQLKHRLAEQQQRASDVAAHLVADPLTAASAALFRTVASFAPAQPSGATISEGIAEHAANIADQLAAVAERLAAGIPEPEDEPDAAAEDEPDASTEDDAPGEPAMAPPAAAPRAEPTRAAPRPTARPASTPGRTEAPRAAPIGSTGGSVKAEPTRTPAPRATARATPKPAAKPTPALDPKKVAEARAAAEKAKAEAEKARTAAQRAKEAAKKTASPKPAPTPRR
jgi:hypothetical protein